MTSAFNTPSTYLAQPVRGRDTAYTLISCVLHSSHIPGTHLNEYHHVWPLENGGPSGPENTIVVCATGHVNLHQLLAIHGAYEGKPPYSLVRTFSHAEREYAKVGYERMTRGAM